MIWNELCQKSLFQDAIHDDSGHIYLEMHDLVHDLAQSITENECMCLEEANHTDLPRNTHHIAFECGVIKTRIRKGSREIAETPFKKRSCEKVESLRTLYDLNWHHWRKVEYFCPTNSSLRVLCTKASKFPSVENLSHLRYLGLSGLHIETIPDSIYTLHKLKILKLMDCGGLCSLPKHLTRLHNLQHLVIDGCDSLSKMCPDIHKLHKLRTLSVYVVNSEEGHSLAELRTLNLGGELHIKGLENVGSISKAKDANLKRKQDLRELSLSWCSSGKTKSVVGAEEVLEALQPHSNLKRLNIVDYGGLHLPTWMGNSSALNSLVSLKLTKCKNCRQLPSLGRLPSLRKLEIRFMDDVQYIEEDESYDGVEAKPFPSLEKLTLYYLPNLERLLKLETTNMFPSLSILEISRCPKLQLPCLPHVKKTV